MKITAQALAALVAAFPHHSAYISERALAGDEEGAIRTQLAAKDREAAAKALAEAQGQLAAEAKAHGETKAALSKLQGEHDKLKALVDGAPTDPGAGSPPAAAKTATQADFDKMDPAARAAFFNAGGTVAG
jgi:hypothetical protein